MTLPLGGYGEGEDYYHSHQKNETQKGRRGFIDPSRGLPLLIIHYKINYYYISDNNSSEEGKQTYNGCDTPSSKGNMTS